MKFLAWLSYGTGGMAIIPVIWMCVGILLTPRFDEPLIWIIRMMMFTMFSGWFVGFIFLGRWFSIWHNSNRNGAR